LRNRFCGDTPRIKGQRIIPGALGGSAGGRRSEGLRNRFYVDILDFKGQTMWPGRLGRIDVMARFVKLSRLQWDIIREIIADDQWHYGWCKPFRSRCAAKERAIGRLIARGIVERCDDHGLLRLCVPLDEVTRHAKDAWARDEEQGKSEWNSKPWRVLDEIRRRQRRALDEVREIRRRERRRVSYEQRHRHDTILEWRRRGVVASTVEFLETEGKPVDAAAVCGVLKGIPGFDELTVADILASLRPPSP
jgi:hypothetical protein